MGKSSIPAKAINQIIQDKLQDTALFRKYTTGRPPLYDNPEDIMNKFVSYIDYCTARKLIPTTTGAALYLGFASRQSMYDYEKRKEFSYTMKRIGLYLEYILENGLYISPNTVAYIFGLKQRGWSDTKRITVDGKMEHEHILGKSQIVPPDEIILERINNSKLSDKEKQKMIKKLDLKQPIQETQDRDIKAEYEVIE